MSEQVSSYVPGYGTFSGADMVVYLVFPNEAPIVIGQVSTISYSVLRDKGELRTLGRISVKGFTKGGRRVAGQLVWTMFNKHLIQDIRDKIGYLGVGSIRNRILLDELPPFDLMISGGTEYGDETFMFIYGVTIIHEGQTISVEDMITEGTCMYIARDVMPFGAKFGTAKANTDFRNFDEVIDKFKISALDPEKANAQWEADRARMEAIIDSQISGVTNPPTSGYSSVTPPSEQTWTNINVKVQIVVTGPDNQPRSDAQARIWVANENTSYPSDNSFENAGADGIVERIIQNVPMTMNGDRDVIKYRITAPGCSDVVASVHLSQVQRDGTAIIPVSIIGNVDSWVITRGDPSPNADGYVYIGEDGADFYVSVTKNGVVAAGVDITWQYTTNTGITGSRTTTTIETGAATFNPMSSINPAVIGGWKMGPDDIITLCVQNPGGGQPSDVWRIKLADGGTSQYYKVIQMSGPNYGAYLTVDDIAALGEFKVRLTDQFDNGINGGLVHWEWWVGRDAWSGGNSMVYELDTETYNSGGLDGIATLDVLGYIIQQEGYPQKGDKIHIDAMATDKKGDMAHWYIVID